MFGVNSRDGGMIGHAREDLPQSVLRHAKSEAPFENVRGLFEDHDLEPVSDARDVGRCAIGRQGGFPDDQRVER